MKLRDERLELVALAVLYGVLLAVLFNPGVGVVGTCASIAGYLFAPSERPAPAPPGPSWTNTCKRCGHNRGAHLFGDCRVVTNIQYPNGRDHNAVVTACDCSGFVEPFIP